ncbi:hypothetical protein [Kitasatospora sp. NPDC088134]|uniref:hypothetical protein n=1 Tax=Kitasatospora sp. NPDC088134 TaxID=3364071 RepID=UPI0038070784
MLTNFMYVTVCATNQGRALEFYGNGLGLEKRIDFAGPRGGSWRWGRRGVQCR